MFQKDMEHKWKHQNHYSMDNHQATELHEHAVMAWARQQCDPDDLVDAEPQYREALN